MNRRETSALLKSIREQRDQALAANESGWDALYDDSNAKPLNPMTPYELVEHERDLVAGRFGPCVSHDRP